MNVLSNFLINAIANDPDVAEPFFRLMLSILLDIDIDRIVVHAQAFVPGNTPERRGIQMDVVVTEYLEKNEAGASCRIYNVEAQLYPDLYMITITNYDPFDRDSMVYTFENACHEFPDLEYEDGLKFIYFNTTGTSNITKAKKELLKYLNSSKIENVTNKDIAQLHDYVSSVKQSAEVQNHYMTVGEWLDTWGKEMATEMANKMVAESRLEERVAILSDILRELGPIPDGLQARLKDMDEQTLKRWTKLAARAESVEEFLEQI